MNGDRITKCLLSIRWMLLFSFFFRFFFSFKHEPFSICAHLKYRMGGKLDVIKVKHCRFYSRGVNKFSSNIMLCHIANNKWFFGNSKANSNTHQPKFCSPISIWHASVNLQSIRSLVRVYMKYDESNLIYYVNIILTRFHTCLND